MSDPDNIIRHMQARHAARNIRIAEEALAEGTANREATEKNERERQKIMAQHMMITQSIAALLRRQGGTITIPRDELESNARPNVTFRIIEEPQPSLVVTLIKEETTEADEEPAIGELGIDNTAKEDEQP